LSSSQNPAETQGFWSLAGREKPVYGFFGSLPFFPQKPIL
jgi:hypothetical protein